MKILYIIIGLAVITGIGLGMQKATQKPVSQELQTPQTGDLPNNSEGAAENMPMMNDHGMTAEEHAAMMGESVQGSDVGMEMPVADEEMPTGAMGMHTNVEAKTFMVHGSNFSFDPQEIRVKKGDTVTINFMSMDGFHDVVIDEFDARTEKIRTGGMASVTFVADKTGTFEYYCSVGSHRMNGMTGKLIVE